MEYRKLKASALFDGYQFQEDRVLLVEESGVIAGLVPSQEAGPGVEKLEGILMPGLVNCHCHLELSHMKGRVPEKTGLVDFVFKIVTERHHSATEIRQAIASAEEEMVRNGIVAVGDICNNDLTLARKQENHLQYYNFIEASGWLPSLSTERFDRARVLYEQFRASLPGTACSIVPHAPYSVSEPLWHRIQPFFENKVASIHNQETAFEDLFFLEGKGDFERMYRLMNIDNSHHRPTRKTSLQSYLDHLTGAANILMVHNTFTGREDMAYVKALAGKGTGPHTGPEAFFCLCINANRYIENALPPVNLLRGEAATIVLGTDSLASNHELDILGEIRTIREFFPDIPLAEMLGWATRNGARALQMEDRLGSFEKGKRPGVVLVDEKSLRVKKVLTEGAHS
ncbi:MAG: amidohydrolase family protein [Flavisolibacter sp.]